MTAPKPRTKVVLGTVGTDVHPFDRLVGWLDSWAKAHPDFEVVIQYGSSSPPTVANGIHFLTHDALLEWMARASVVVTHGGPATIMEVRARHGTPIVIPRNPAFGEHVDRHQLDFCGAMARRDLVQLAQSSEHLEGLINGQLASPPQPASNSHTVPEGVTRFAQEVDAMLSRSAPSGTAAPARPRARRTR
jgi:UDP-N-acetylglucosamine transferase subunit ALG13